jgi:hypothetical protein
MSTSNSLDAAGSQFVVTASRHTIETSGIALMITHKEKSESGVGAIWRADPTPALLAGVAYGPVNMTFRLRMDQSLNHVLECEDAVVVPVKIYGSVSFFGEAEIPGVDVPVFHVPEGSYQLCVSSSGADLNYDLAVTQPSQTFHIELWPSSESEPRVLALGSRTAISYARLARASGSVRSTIQGAGAVADG